MNSDSPFIYDQDTVFLPVAASPSADKRQMGDEWWNSARARSPFGCKRRKTSPYPKANITKQWLGDRESEFQTILTASQNEQAYFDNGKKQHAVNAGYCCLGSNW